MAKQSSLLRAGLILALLDSGPAVGQAGPVGRDWVARVVNRIGAAQQVLVRRALARGEAVRAGRVTVRLRIAADGALAAAVVEEGSGSDALDARALEAAADAAPFDRPPQGLLALDGFTELSFPLEFSGRGRPRR